MKLVVSFCSFLYDTRFLELLEGVVIQGIFKLVLLFSCSIKKYDSFLNYPVTVSLPHIYVELVFPSCFLCISYSVLITFSAVSPLPGALF